MLSYYALSPLDEKSNKSAAGGEVEMTLEVRVKKNNADFMDTFSTHQKIISAVLLEYSGDYN